MTRDKSFMRVLPLGFGLLLAATTAARAQSPGSIEILEPTAWAISQPRGLTVVQRSSVEVRGIVTHPQGIRAVYLNGRKAGLQPRERGGWEFKGFADVQEGAGEVLIRVEPNAGPAFSRSYPLVIRPAGSRVEIPDADAFEGERWAVVIGISEYEDPGIPDLQYADDDARAIYEFLRSPAAGLDGYKEENIRLLINEEATFQGIRQALFTFLKNPTDEDVVLIYFAGHGAPDLDRPDNLYLLPYDSRADDISSTGFPMDDVQDAVSQTYYKHLVLLTDACHSAGVSGRASTRMLGSNPINEAFLEGLASARGGGVTITASEVNQLSQEGTQWGNGHGVFTYYLLEALRGAADEDGNQLVTLGEATEFVRDRVRRETRNAQIPTISTTAFDRYLPLAAVLTPPDEEEAPPVETPAPAVNRPTPTQPPAGRREEEAAEAVNMELFEPSQAALKSFFMPGAGQLSTGRKGPGIGFLAGFAGALGTGLLITETQIECASPNPTSCPSGDILSEVSSRPYLGAGVGAALAICAIAAWDAYRGAHQHNARVRALTAEGSSYTLERPRLTASPATGVAVEWLRVRF